MESEKQPAAAGPVELVLGLAPARDLVERLRLQWPDTPHHRDGLHREAADEIERLRGGHLCMCQPVRVPLTEEQRAQLFVELNQPCVRADSPSAMFALIVQAVERAHGIGA